MASSERFGNVNAEHLIVLVHGLWGQPTHMHTVAEQIQAKHGDEKVRIMIPSTNKFYNTYDGIEVGGERVASEVEAEIAAAKLSGRGFKRISMVGYSLGGLIARYCIGLLYARGHFEPVPDSDGVGGLEAVNFTTFATPWVGVRSPTRVLGINLWNFFGSRVLSTSGQQMFIADRFRQMGRPLLVIMADPSSIFMKALATFRKRVIYSNIVNDRSVPFSTSCIVAQDPFLELERRDFSFIPGFAPTIIDINKPVTTRPAEKDLYSQFVNTVYGYLTKLPLFLFVLALLPITSIFFFANAGVQTVRSGARIRSHEGLGNFADYRIPLLLEQALEAAATGSTDPLLDDASLQAADQDAADELAEQHSAARSELARINKASGLQSDAKTLNLMPEQFEIIRNLNMLDIRKFPVHIQLVTHTHAAIIVRWKKEAFREGFTVIRHWLEQEFDLI